MSTVALPKKIEDLLATGMTYKSIAEKTGCDMSTIFRIKKGDISRPSYAIGSAIDELHSNLEEKAVA
jgi:uncharacterized protein YerC